MAVTVNKDITVQSELKGMMTLMRSRPAHLSAEVNDQLAYAANLLQGVLVRLNCPLLKASLTARLR